MVKSKAELKTDVEYCFAPVFNHTNGQNEYVVVDETHLREVLLDIVDSIEEEGDSG